jgi:hypothetical protein
LPTANQYGSVSALRRSTTDQRVENEYDNVDVLLPKDKSPYKDWNEAENPAPAHYIEQPDDVANPTF